ncbi:MAG: hypothetical protein WBJ35_05895 [Acetomicrobium sp.]|jgi:hypothetical protein
MPNNLMVNFGLKLAKEKTLAETAERSMCLAIPNMKAGDTLH